MKKLLLVLGLITLITGSLYAAQTVTYPYTIANSQTADGSKVQANLDEVGNKVNTHAAATTGEHGVTGTIVGTGTAPSFTGLSLSGVATNSAQPSFLVKAAGTQTDFADGPVHTIEWATEIKDKSSEFSASTFTATTAGLYQFSVVVQLLNVDSASQYYVLALTTTNRTYYNYYDSDVELSGDATYVTLTLNILADLDAGETAYVTIGQNNGDHQTDIGAESYFSGFLVN